MTELAIQRQAPQAALRALKQPIYDCQEAPAAATPSRTLTFFQSPLGNPMNVTGTLKNTLDTSLSQSGQLGIPNEFEMFGINMTVQYEQGYIEDSTVAATPTIANFFSDMTEIYEQGLLRFIFGQNRPYFEVPLTRIPHGDFMLTGPAGVGQDNAAGTGVNVFAISNGISAKKSSIKHS